MTIVNQTAIRLGLIAGMLGIAFAASVHSSEPKLGQTNQRVFQPRVATSEQAAKLPQSPAFELQ